VRRWGPALIVTAGGAVIFGLSLAHGQGLELLWLPAVLLACAWPRGTSRRCRERL
jgi:hypothetical protein